MRIISRQEAIYFFLTLGVWLAGAVCGAQSSLKAFEDEHAHGVKENPAGVEFSISTVGGRSTYHISDWIQLNLTLTSKEPRVYTFESTSGMTTAAGANDDMVIVGPDVVSPLHTLARVMIGHLCCETKRRYLSLRPSSATFGLRFVDIPRYTQSIPNVDFTTPAEITPGEYAVFMQTRRVLRGWPKSEREKYSVASDIVVTSNNILHLTILPDAAEPGSKP